MFLNIFKKQKEQKKKDDYKTKYLEELKEVYKKSPIKNFREEGDKYTFTINGIKCEGYKVGERFWFPGLYYISGLDSCEKSALFKIIDNKLKNQVSEIEKEKRYKE